MEQTKALSGSTSTLVSLSLVAVDREGFLLHDYRISKDLSVRVLRRFSLPLTQPTKRFNSGATPFSQNLLLIALNLEVIYFHFHFEEAVFVLIFPRAILIFQMFSNYFSNQRDQSINFRRDNLNSLQRRVTSCGFESSHIKMLIAYKSC